MNLQNHTLTVTFGDCKLVLHGRLVTVISSKGYTTSYPASNATNIADHLSGVDYADLKHVIRLFSYTALQRKALRWVKSELVGLEEEEAEAIWSIQSPKPFSKRVLNWACRELGLPTL